MNEQPPRCELAPPPEVITLARAVLGAIDLDPYSTPAINGLVGAARFHDRDSLDFNALLAMDWDCPGEGRLFAGPPSGAGVTRRLLNKTLREYRAGRIQQALLWLAHNETLIRAPWLWDFPLCIPFRRLRPCFYDDELEQWRTVSPSDWSALLYLPPASPPVAFATALSRFCVAAAPLGRVVFDSSSGDDTWQHSYQSLIGRPYNYRD